MLARDAVVRYDEAIAGGSSERGFRRVEEEASTERIAHVLDQTGAFARHRALECALIGLRNAGRRVVGHRKILPPQTRLRVRGAMTPGLLATLGGGRDPPGTASLEPAHHPKNVS